MKYYQRYNNILAGGRYQTERYHITLSAWETGKQRGGSDRWSCRAGDVWSRRIQSPSAIRYLTAGYDRVRCRSETAQSLCQAVNALKDKQNYLDVGMGAMYWANCYRWLQLTQVIKHYWVHQPFSHCKETGHQAIQINESLLDTTMLKQYLDLVGSRIIHQSLAMFEQMMPGYLAVLDTNMTTCDQKISPKRSTRSKVLLVQSAYIICNS